MQKQRAHPLNILEHTAKFFLLLLLPLLRGLFSSFHGGVMAWLQGSWFDLLLIFAIVGLGYVNWYFFSYTLTDTGIEIQKGILFKRTTYLPFNQISTVTRQRPFYLRPFRVSNVFVDTDAGMSQKSDFHITVSDRDAQLLIETMRGEQNQWMLRREVYHPSNLYVLILSFVVSNTISGVIFVFTLIKQLGHVLGREIEQMLILRLQRLLDLLAFGLPRATAILAYVILGGFTVSVLLSFIRHFHFGVQRTKKELKISCGLFFRRSYSIAVPKVNWIEIRQNIVTKLLHFYSVFLHCAGYGKQKGAVAAIIPGERKKDAIQVLASILPEIPIQKAQIRPDLRVVSRFLIPPLTLIVCCGAGFGLLYRWLPSVHDTILFLGIMAQIPGWLWFGVKIIAFRHTSVGDCCGVYTFRYVFGYKIFTTIVSADKIQKMIIRQSLFQKMAGCCDLVVYCYCEGKKRFAVQNLPIREVQRLDIVGQMA